MEEEAVKLMEEMDRFEAEIATDPPPNAERQRGARAIIGANTFNTVQRKLLDNNARPRFEGRMGPPPPGPQSGPLVPLQLPPPPPPPNMSGFPGPMPPPGVFPSIPPPPPPPAFLIPHQVRAPRPGPPMGRLPPPPPPMAGPMAPRSRPGPAVLSAAPTKYKAPAKKAKIDDELAEFLNEINKEEEKTPSSPRQGKSQAKIMAEQVKANTVVSIQPVAPEPIQEESFQPPSHGGKPKKEKKNKKLVRMAGGQVWEDNSLVDWEDDDFRIFCGDLGNDVTDEVLIRAFNKYSSFLKAKVVRDKRTNKTKGFGFVSFKDPQDFIRAMKEMNGRYVGSRPIKLRKSCWRQRSLDVVKKKEKEKAALINLLTGR